ncbi:semaphorin-5A-like [Saccostrea cucullata]|uniref:semaphorin-5A-like n=1 Tax=Saccostrea cuccullata TaxID=36930 RepID=UPI002ED0ADED
MEITIDGRVFPGELPWTEAVKQCGTCSLKTDIIGHYTGLTDSHKNHEFWTGFYRQSYVYWSPPGGLESGRKNSNLHHCIAVKVNEDGTLYPVTYPQDCSESLPSICEKSTKRDGGWSDWSDWSECYFVNGMDKKSKTRTCTNPSPRHGGKYCEGDDKIERPCLEPQFVGGIKEKTVPSKENGSKQRK